MVVERNAHRGTPSLAGHRCLDVDRPKEKARMNRSATPMPGQSHPADAGDVSLAGWVELVIEAVRERYPNERTATKVAREAERLFRFLMAHGAETWSDLKPEQVRQWLWAARAARSGRWKRAAQSTARNRQWAARAAFEEALRLGAPICPASLIGVPIPRQSPADTCRPLTDEEAHLVREHTVTGLLFGYSLLVALSFAGGTATEVAGVRRCDVDLDIETVAFDGASARVNPLGAWPAEVIGLWLNNRPTSPAPDDLLCVREHLSTNQAAHSVTVRLRRVLHDAGLGGRPGVSARSLRLTTAKKALERDGIEAAARFLGNVSLDTTAASLGYGWRFHHA